ncbi:MAG: S41 family peptidase [Planctomycetes bacterium]|nr:S41 family peptidase [Planctomycetota bacterium]
MNPLLALAGAMAPQSAPADLTRAQMEEDLRHAATVVGRAWSWAQDKKENFGVDLDAIAARLAARLDGVKTKAEFAALLEEFVASMKDGHAGLDMPGAAPKEIHALPFRLLDAREGVLIADLPEDLAKSTGVGDALVAVDGMPIETLLEERARRVFASTDGARRAWTIRKLRFEKREVSVTVRRSDGSEKTVPVPTGAAPESKEGAPISWRALGEKTALLRVAAFTPPPEEWKRFGSETPEARDRTVETWREGVRRAFAGMGAREAVVLDLRGNGGGTDLLGQFLAEQFLEGEFLYFRLRTRLSPEVLALPGFEVWKSMGRTEGWTDEAAIRVKRRGPSSHLGRLVVLIDERCFSVTDNFLACLRDLHPSARFVGRPTGGGTGAPRKIATLPHSGATITACVMEPRSPKGRLIEGRGTAPDVPVRWSRDDLLSGRDPDLEAALRELAAAR